MSLFLLHSVRSSRRLPSAASPLTSSLHLSEQLPPKLPLADASTAFNPGTAVCSTRLQGLSRSSYGIRTGTAKEEKRRRKRANKRQRDAQTEYSAASSLIGDLPPVPSEGSIPAAPPSQRTLNGQRRIMQQNHTILSLGSFEDGLDFGVAVEKTGMSEELLKERWNSLLFTQYHFPGTQFFVASSVIVSHSRHRCSQAQDSIRWQRKLVRHSLRRLYPRR